MEAGTAVRLLVELCKQGQGQSCLQLARTTHLPFSVCIATLRMLQDNGLVYAEQDDDNKKKITYVATRPAAAFKISEIFAAVDEKVINSVCLFCKEKPSLTTNGNCCAVGAFIRHCTDGMERMLAGTTIQDLLDAEQADTGTAK